MGQIVKKATAGTMESSDAYIEISPGKEGEGLDIQLESVVYHQFGQAIRKVAEEVLQEFSIERAKVRIVDRGALDCVLRARMETAIRRGIEEE